MHFLLLFFLSIDAKNRIKRYFRILRILKSFFYNKQSSSTRNFFLPQTIFYSSIKKPGDNLQILQIIFLVSINPAVENCRITENIFSVFLHSLRKSDILASTAGWPAASRKEILISACLCCILAFLSQDTADGNDRCVSRSTDSNSLRLIHRVHYGSVSHIKPYVSVI